MSPEVRFGVIGAGAWGINHVRVIASESGCALVGVADPDPTTRPRIASLAPLARYMADPGDLLADSTIDAVVIASPSTSHAHWVCAALEAKKHVLVEKPFALTVPDAMRMAANARRANTIVMVGHLMVHHPAVVRLKSLVRDGVLGQLHYIHATRANLGHSRGDSVLWSFGPHDLSMIEFLLEQWPISVSARGRCVANPGVEDVVFLSLRYPDDVMAHLHLSWLSPRKERRLALVGSERVIELDDVAQEKLHIFERGYDRPPQFTRFDEYLALRQGDVHIPQLVMEEPLRLQARSFVDAIRSNRPAPCGPTSALATVAILDAAQQSLTLDGAPRQIDYPLETTSILS